MAGDAISLVALVALLVVAWSHPRRSVEAAVAVAAAVAVVGAGALGADAAWRATRDLLPVVGFLVAILVVADICARAGLFTAAAVGVRRMVGGGTTALFTGVFVLAAAITIVLSLDATVVLFTPVAIGAAMAAGAPGRPFAHACLRMANSASLLLPVSNLTNLLAGPYLTVGFGGFAARMAPVLAVVLVIEYVGLRLLFRRELAATGPGPVAPPAPTRVPPVPLATVAAMLVGFAVLSPLGVAPAWVAGAAALLLVLWRRPSCVELAAAAHPAFAIYVLGLGIVVAALVLGPLGDLVGELLPDRTDFLGLLTVAAVATLVANLVTNLSATLLVVPLVAPLGTTAVLAALVGLNIGSGLTLTGSLANLLWRRGLLASGHPAPLRELHLVSLALTPVSLVAAVGALTLLD